MRSTRPISCIKQAQKAFEKFPKGVRDRVLDALTVATALDSENIVQMKDEKDLDNIRNTERFIRLSNQEI